MQHQANDVSSVHGDQKMERGLLGTKKPFRPLFIVFVIVILLAVPLVMYFLQQKGAGPETKKQTEATTLDTVIAKVGNETIYQRDLETERSYYPGPKTEELDKKLLEKIVTDSIVLQAAQTERVTSLDSSVFNSPTKDYLKRTEAVQTIEKRINDQAEAISGQIISMWILNEEPAIGYEKARQIVSSKITALYNEVKAGRLTMEQAADKIKKDATLAQIDPSYERNAWYEFRNVLKNEPITFDDTFNAMLWNLTNGELTQLYLVKEEQSSQGALRDQMYMFGTVTQRIGRESKDFDLWLQEKKSSYEVIYY